MTEKNCVLFWIAPGKLALSTRKEETLVYFLYFHSMQVFGSMLIQHTSSDQGLKTSCLKFGSFLFPLQKA